MVVSAGSVGPHSGLRRQPLREEKAEHHQEAHTPIIEWPCPGCGQGQKSRDITAAGSYCAACAEEKGAKRPEEVKQQGKKASQH
jgi:hypothetical protein